MMGRAGNFDYRELQKLRDELNKLNQNIEAFLDESAKELAARLLRMVKQKTPVDTGTLRRSWTIGEIHKNGNDYVVDVKNPKEYATYVEYGHRTAGHTGWVSGRFMLTISEQELERIAPQVLENKIRKFLGGIAR